MPTPSKLNTTQEGAHSASHQLLLKRDAAEKGFSSVAGCTNILVGLRQTVLGTSRAAVNRFAIEAKIPCRFKLGLLGELQAPGFSVELASE